VNWKLFDMLTLQKSGSHLTTHLSMHSLIPANGMTRDDLLNAHMITVK